MDQRYCEVMRAAWATRRAANPATASGGEDGSRAVAPAQAENAPGGNSQALRECLLAAVGECPGGATEAVLAERPKSNGGDRV